MKILKAYSVPSNLLRATGVMYTETRAKVITPDGNTEEFVIMAGALQGDTPAPFRFIIVLDCALRQAISGWEEKLGFTICLLSNRMEQAQVLLTRVKTECVSS